MTKLTPAPMPQKLAESTAQDRSSVRIKTDREGDLPNLKGEERNILSLTPSKFNIYVYMIYLVCIYIYIYIYASPPPKTYLLDYTN